MAFRATLHAAVNALVALATLCAALQVKIEANVLALVLRVASLKGFRPREVRRFRFLHVVLAAGSGLVEVGSVRLAAEWIVQMPSPDCSGGLGQVELGYLCDDNYAAGTEPRLFSLLFSKPFPA